MATPFDETNSSHRQADALMEQAQQLLRRGQASAAIGLWNSALEQLRQGPAPTRLIALCHAGISWALLAVDQTQDALDHFDQARQLFERLEGAERDKARCRRGMGQALRSLARYEEAVAQQECALA